MTKLMMAAMTASVTMKYQNAVTTRSSPRSGRCGTLAPGTARVSMSRSPTSSAPWHSAGRECTRAGGGWLASPVYHTPRFWRHGPTTSRTFEAMAGAERLGGVLPVPLVYADETFSTVQAEERLRARGVRPERMRRQIDSAAAAVILQDYLDQPPPRPDAAARFPELAPRPTGEP